jgi:hypothetical protein
MLVKVGRMSDNSKGDGMSESKSSGGIGLGGAVFVVFLVLKLLGHIDWSWWWVTSPLWLPACVALAIAGVVFVVVFLFAALSELFSN